MQPNECPVLQAVPATQSQHTNQKKAPKRKVAIFLAYVGAGYSVR